MSIQERIMAARAASGLKMVFNIPGDAVEPEGRVFTCYAKDDAQKALWLSQYTARGWELVK